MKKVKIEDATNGELFAFCETVLGLEVKRGMNDTQLRAKIAQVLPDATEITVFDASPAPSNDDDGVRVHDGRTRPIEEKVIGGGKVPNTGHHADPKVEIRIPSNREPGGDKDVMVSVNGYQWQIKRDEWVKVPLRVYVALANAVETTYEEIESEDGRGTVRIARDNPSYTFSAKNVPSDEEIVAWAEGHAKQAA